jgi:hypothetical protein
VIPFTLTFVPALTKMLIAQFPLFMVALA